MALGLSQSVAANRAGVSQAFWSLLERGGGSTASLETLTACAGAVETQLAAFIEARPGSDLPRDIEHLRRQELLVRIAQSGKWKAAPEQPIDPDARRSRSVDILLRREGRSEPEIAVIEVEDFLADIGQVFRRLADKVAVVRRNALAADGTGRAPRVAGLLVVRHSRRNHQLVEELAELFAARFPASGRAWLAALTSESRPMPAVDGWLWTTSRGDRLTAPSPGPGVRGREAFVRSPPSPSELGPQSGPSPLSRLA
ncbi:MAG: helix-turn-helix transcriptional regulator [Chloroflexi bacterium]|nr:helix-turn-helix transcriptional regulator [Chloroflexota bacterium]